MRQFHAVCFDAFGTVAEIVDERDPWRKLFEKLGIPFSVGRRAALTVDGGIEDVLERLGMVGSVDLEEFNRDLAAEAASVRLFDDVVPALTRLRNAGVRTWIISNLAMPYGEPLERLLGKHVEGFTFSYRCGLVKPEPAIFFDACRCLDLAPGELLMVGDKRRNDVEGALAVGMSARLIDRSGNAGGPLAVKSLAEIEV
ncbi:HAD family hydrolase [bacterium]|nr:HAD family hydrolase [bacterium]